MVWSGINPWFTTEAATQSSLDISSMTMGVAVDQISCREQSLIGGWFPMSSHTGQCLFPWTLVTITADTAFRRIPGGAMLAKTGNRGTGVNVDVFTKRKLIFGQNVCALRALHFSYSKSHKIVFYSRFKREILFSKHTGRKSPPSWLPC